MNNKISIIIPTYNRAHAIKDTLESLRFQSYPKWECLIIDDDSTDNSEGIIREYIKNDTRFKFIKKPISRKKGAATIRNIGIENVAGHFIQFLDSDDSMAFDKFEVQINRLKNEFPQTLATCRYGISRPPFFQPKISNGLKTYRDFKNPMNLFKVFAENFTYFPLHTYLIPLTVIEKSGKWNEDLSVNDDGEYFSRIILNSSQIVFCNKTYVVYRTGAGNRISTKITKLSGVQSYIQGWNLIDENIYAKTGIKNHLYVQSAKSNLYERLHRENKPLITKPEAFLKERWTNPSYFFAKLLNKVRSKLFIFFTQK